MDKDRADNIKHILLAVLVFALYAIGSDMAYVDCIQRNIC
jgi:hypothetical protein